MDKVPMTPRGQQAMKDELKHLKDVERYQVAKIIEEARGHGDISENADYNAAKEKQSFVEGRIRELEAKLALANVIDPAKLSGTRVMFGATVTVEDTESGEKVTYIIVGEDEADIKAGRIAVTAPVARALIGKEVGETARVRAPKGSRELEIMTVSFEPVSW